MIKYTKNIGSRKEVMNNIAKMTGGKLIKKQLKYNKYGKIVSIKLSNLAKIRYITKKGGAVNSVNVVGNKVSAVGDADAVTSNTNAVTSNTGVKNIGNTLKNNGPELNNTDIRVIIKEPLEYDEYIKNQQEFVTNIIKLYKLYPTLTRILPYCMLEYELYLELFNIYKININKPRIPKQHINKYYYNNNNNENSNKMKEYINFLKEKIKLHNMFNLIIKNININSVGFRTLIHAPTKENNTTARNYHQNSEHTEIYYNTLCYIFSNSTAENGTIITFYEYATRKIVEIQLPSCIGVVLWLLDSQMIHKSPMINVKTGKIHRVLLRGFAIDQTKYGKYIGPPLNNNSVKLMENIFVIHSEDTPNYEVIYENYTERVYNKKHVCKLIHSDWTKYIPRGHSLITRLYNLFNNKHTINKNNLLNKLNELTISKYPKYMHGRRPWINEDGTINGIVLDNLKYPIKKLNTWILFDNLYFGPTKIHTSSFKYFVEHNIPKF